MRFSEAQSSVKYTYIGILSSSVTVGELCRACDSHSALYEPVIGSLNTYPAALKIPRDRIIAINSSDRYERIHKYFRRKNGEFLIGRNAVNNFNWSGRKGGNVIAIMQV